MVQFFLPHSVHTYRQTDRTEIIYHAGDIRIQKQRLC